MFCGGSRTPTPTAALPCDGGELPSFAEIENTLRPVPRSAPLGKVGAMRAGAKCAIDATSRATLKFSLAIGFLPTAASPPPKPPPIVARRTH
jgi:hypothetical protein